jgi:aldose sugar dehydrogenase
LNGVLEDKPILEVPVDITSEGGLLGIAVMSEGSNNDTNAANISEPLSGKTKTVFLYYTESKGGELLGNRVYKYEWNRRNLINPKLILDLPAFDGPNHDGGKLAMGSDNYLYAIIGDLNHRGKLQNIENGPDPDDTGVIFRIDPNNGSAATNHPFANIDNDALKRYYAYGIRNSFGIAFDPVNGICRIQKMDQKRMTR